MGIPIFVLAGQSNAVAIEDEIQASLEQRYGIGNYRLVSVSANGAPLTYARALQDWYAPNELRADLVNQTVQMLNATPDGEIAGIIWLQGEADTTAGARAHLYETRLTELITEFRSAVDAATGSRQTGIETANFVISALSADAPMATNRIDWTTVTTAQTAVASSQDYLRLVSPDAVSQTLALGTAGVFKDGLHYTNSFAAQLADALVGAALNPDDTIYGTAGADRMAAGRGDDIYIVNHVDDRVIEFRGQGTDTIQASVSYSLRLAVDEVENLTLTGTANLNGSGNGLGNVIIGNAGSNRLDGAGGADVLYGMAGDDVLVGGYGADRLYGGAGNDRLIGGAGFDRLWGGAGADTFVMADSGVWREQVMDYEDGIDLIDLRGSGARALSDLIFVAADDGIVVNYGVGSFQLVGMSQAQLDAGDFIF